MVRPTTLLFSLPLAAAWPAVMEMVARGPESGRPNTATPPAGFSEAQLVDVSAGSGHEYQRPGPKDLRGQCPGLNAAANHGFLPRSGLLTIQNTIDGLTGAYNMAASQALILSILSIALGGDVLTETWSIGSSFPGTGAGLLGSPGGLVSTHNAYEGDASPVSGDAYLDNGYVGRFQQDRWQALMEIGENGYNFDILAKHNQYTIDKSIATNPYYFSAPLSGMVVIPGAHNFMVAFMSNHTAANPGGYLTRDHLQTFFGVSGDTPGQYKFDYASQRIPDNWYKMPVGNSYTIEQTVADAFTNGALYPGITRLGGNTGKVNTFTGLDVGDFTSGLYNAGTLAQGNNALCFALQATMAAKSDEADIIGFLNKNLGGVLNSLNCPAFDSTRFDSTKLEKFPGYKYKAQGQ